MTDWWQSMNIFQQILALFALPATLVLIIQTLMLLFGFGHDSGADAPDGEFELAGGEPAADAAELAGSPEGTAAEGDAGLPESGADFDAGLRLLTVRGMVAFFAAGGWVGIAAADLGASVWLSALAALISGLAALWLVAVIFKALMRLQSSGNVSLGSAIGTIGEVYLRIPPALSGQGKVTVQVQERLIEAAAMTKATTELPSGSAIRVIAVQGSRLLVEPVEGSQSQD